MHENVILKGEHSIFAECPHCKRRDNYETTEGIEITYVMCITCLSEFIVIVDVTVTKSENWNL